MLRPFGGTPRDKFTDKAGPVTAWSSSRGGTRYRITVDDGLVVDELAVEADGTVPAHNIDLPDLDNVVYWEFADGTRKLAHPAAVPDRVAWLEEQVTALAAELAELRGRIAPTKGKTA